MNRRPTIVIKRREAEEAPPHVPCAIEEWAERIGMVVVVLIMSAAVALNVPEAPSEGTICGPDRDAPTIEAGCQP